MKLNKISPLRLLSTLRPALRPILRRGGLPGLFVLCLLTPLALLHTPEETSAPVPTPASSGIEAVRADPGSLTGAWRLSQADAHRSRWSWDQAKRLSAASWDATGTPLKGFYCGCDISRRGATGGDVDLASCGQTPRRSESRASRLEWEHIVPASRIGQGRACWTTGAPACVKNGKAFKGRSCCEIADPIYNLAATDPVNLVPSSGEVNGDRSDFPFGEISGEARIYGQCDMEIDWDLDLAEPPAGRRGDIARIWAYMSKAYGITLDRPTAELYAKWHAEDPVSQEEIDINRAIRATGHRANPLVLP